MFNMKKRSVKGIALVCVFFMLSFCLAGCGGAAKSDSDPLEGYPDRPISVIVPYAPGGSGDIQARIIANYLQEKLGQTVNVVAKPGGAGAVGMNELKKAKPDGYTIILTALGPCTLTPNHSDVGYNTPEDFEPICQISLLTYGLATNADSGIKTLDELMEYAKKNPGTTFGTCGAGLHQHLIMTEFLNQFPDIDMEHVPFNGGAEAVGALLGNHVMCSMNALSELQPHYKAGTFNLLAVTDSETNKDFPDVPTFTELGYKDVPAGAWFGFMAPKDTPKEIIELLDKTIKEGLDDPDVQDQFAKASLTINYKNTEDFSKVVKEDWDSNKALIEQLKADGVL